MTFVKVVRPQTSEDTEVWRSEDTAPTLNGFASGGEVRATVLAVSENQRGEIRLTDYSRQLTTGGGKPGQGYPAVLRDLAVRRLTPIECERLQGFPDDWTAGQADSHRYRQLGNAVAVPVAEWVARQIIGATP